VFFSFFVVLRVCVCLKVDFDYLKLLLLFVL
jgi:hypothetical protein